MKTQLTITIEGLDRSGKTLITSIIEDALKEKGVSVTVNDQGGPKYYTIFKCELKHNIDVRDEMFLNEFCEKTNVTINQKRVPRSFQWPCEKNE